MMDLHALSRRVLPRSLRRRLTQLGWLPGAYDSVTVDEQELQEGAYKRYLGGGAENWDRRGQFQLHLLRTLGLESHHRFLDLGCGPLRAGRYFIRYLGHGCYTGVDYNEGFISAARRTLVDEGLETQGAQLAVVRDFDLATVAGEFDRGLAFSVLNHCTAGQRKAFFRNVPPRLAPNALLYITHGWWFTERILTGSGLRVSRVLEAGDTALRGASITDWGWTGEEEVFPVVELAKN